MLQHCCRCAHILAVVNANRRANEYAKFFADVCNNHFFVYCADFFGTVFVDACFDRLAVSFADACAVTRVTDCAHVRANTRIAESFSADRRDIRIAGYFILNSPILVSPRFSVYQTDTRIVECFSAIRADTCTST